MYSSIEYLSKRYGWTKEQEDEYVNIRKQSAESIKDKYIKAVSDGLILKEDLGMWLGWVNSYFS